MNRTTIQYGRDYHRQPKGVIRMARSIRGSKAGGWEHWSRRPNSTSSPGRISKKITSGMERTQERQLIYQELQQL